MAIIQLAPNDYFFVRPNIPPIRLLLCLPERLDLERLRRGLAGIIQAGFPVTARLQPTAGDFVLHVDEPAAVPPGTLRLVTHDTDLPVAFSPALDRLFDPLATGVGVPLFKVVLHQHRSGSMLAVAMSHLLGDARSLFMLLEAWSRAYAGAELPIPSFDRTPLWADLDPPKRLPSIEEIDAATRYLMTDDPPRVPPGNQPVRIRIADRDVDRIMAEARSASINAALVAHLFHCFWSDIYTMGESDVVVRFPVDFRKLHPGVPKNFFGNAVLDVVARFDPERVADSTLVELAERIGAAAAAADLARVRAQLGCFEAIRRCGGLDALFSLHDYGLAITNMTGFTRRPVTFEGVPAELFCCSPTCRTINLVRTAGAIEAQYRRYLPPPPQAASSG